MEFPKYIVKIIGTSDVGTGILIDNDLWIFSHVGASIASPFFEEIA